MSRPTVLVLAGGVSNRFWPLRDKLFIQFGTQTLLERHLLQLRALGCTKFVVVARPETSPRSRLCGRSSTPTSGSPSSRRRRAWPTPSSAPAKPSTRSKNDSLYVTQAHDVVSPVLHQAMLGALDSNKAEGYLAAQRVTSYFPGGYLTFDGARVTSVVEKPGAGNEPSDLVSIVAHGFTSWRKVVEAIEAVEGAGGGGRRLRARAHPSHDGQEFRAVVYEGRWQALKYPWHLLDVMDMLFERWTSGAESPGDDYEQRETASGTAATSSIFPGGHVAAPALLGHGAVVGNNALVRGSIVGPGSVVGFGSEVARSYLAGGVELHHNYVGDSVFDRHSSMGYGATTANYRLDGRTVPSSVGDERIDSGRMKLGLMLGAGTKIGVNTSTMPGVKIGAGAMVGANLRITRDVPGRERAFWMREAMDAFSWAGRYCSSPALSSSSLSRPPKPA